MSEQITQELRHLGVAQVIVVLKPAGAAAAAAAPVVSALKKHFVTSERSHSSALAMAAGKKPSSVPLMRHYKNLGVMLGTVNRDGLAALRADKSRVARVIGAPALSLIRPEQVVAAKLTTKVTWGIRTLGVPALWDQGLTGKGILIGHLDTGADGRHPALKTAIASFAEFDDLGREVRPAPAPHDTGEHGTHTAATIAGREVAGKSVGVAKGADLASAIVIEGGNVVARVLGGMDWALGLGIRVLSMSLGFRGVVEDFLPLTQILRSRNVLPVFAVGNEGAGTSRSPGNYSEALSVGAVDRNNEVPDFSSSQEFERDKDPLVPDLVAPGVRVISAKPGGGFQSMNGTSMATPHVAGLAALLMEAKPAATVDEVEQAIFQSCDIGDLPTDRANRGFPDAVRALAALTGA